jgi:hypothetical protein
MVDPAFWILGILKHAVMKMGHQIFRLIEIPIKKKRWGTQSV